MGFLISTHFTQAAILFFAHKKIAQGCQSGIRLILVQDMLEHQNQQKNLVQPQVHA